MCMYVHTEFPKFLRNERFAHPKAPVSLIASDKISLRQTDPFNLSREGSPALSEYRVLLAE